MPVFVDAPHTTDPTFYMLHDACLVRVCVCARTCACVTAAHGRIWGTSGPGWWKYPHPWLTWRTPAIWTRIWSFSLWPRSGHGGGCWTLVVDVHCDPATVSDPAVLVLMGEGWAFLCPCEQCLCGCLWVRGQCRYYVAHPALRESIAAVGHALLRARPMSAHLGSALGIAHGGGYGHRGAMT